MFLGLRRTGIEPEGSVGEQGKDDQGLMESGFAWNLALEAIVILVVSSFIARRVLSWPGALALATAKVSLPFVYFVFWFDRGWTLVDDILYFQQGQQLLVDGFTPQSLLLSSEGRGALLASSGGHHVLYGLYNFLAQWMFGPQYFAAVFVNVALTIWTALFLYRIARQEGMSRRYSRAFFVFFSFHWEVLAWSSLVNLKDTVILFLTVALMYTVIQLFQQRTTLRTLRLLILVILFYFIRFYVPLIVFASLTIYMAARIFRRRALRGALILSAVLVVYVSIVGTGQLAYWADALNLGPALIYGTFRMALTPLPWSIDPSYSFLLVPSLFHWVLAVPAVIGAVGLWQRHPGTRIVLIYGAVILILYGAFGQLQGPRHRLQIVFVYAWAQFHFIWELLSLRRQTSFVDGHPSTAGPDSGVSDNSSSRFPGLKDRGCLIK